MDLDKAMTWAVSPSAIKDPAAVEALMMALGKSLYLACEFERKCQYVLRVLNLVEMFEATDDVKVTFVAAAAVKDRMLSETIKGMAKTRALAPEEIEALMKARDARNYIAHESGKIGSLHDLQARHVVEALNSLRPRVVDVAKGDNIISAWSLAIQEKQIAPEWMTQAYEARVLSWIF